MSADEVQAEQPWTAGSAGNATARILAERTLQTLAGHNDLKHLLHRSSMTQNAMSVWKNRGRLNTLHGNARCWQGGWWDFFDTLQPDRDSNSLLRFNSVDCIRQAKIYREYSEVVLLKV